MIQNLLSNWKTTSAGLGIVTTAIIHLVFQIKAGNNSEETWTVTVGGILGGIGLITAGDANSQPVAIEPPAVAPTETPQQ